MAGSFIQIFLSHLFLDATNLSPCLHGTGTSIIAKGCTATGWLLVVVNDASVVTSNEDSIVSLPADSL